MAQAACALLLMGAILAPLHAKDSSTREGGGSPEEHAALWRSVLLPGWGQWRQNRPRAALTFAAAFGGLLLFTRQSLDDYNTHRGEYASASAGLIAAAFAVPDNTALLVRYAEITAGRRRAMERTANRTNLLAAGMFALYAWNLADVYMHFRSPGSPASVSLGPDGFQVGYHFSF